MDKPIVFISRSRATEVIEANKPGTFVFLKYPNEVETELIIVHIFPDDVPQALDGYIRFQ